MQAAAIESVVIQADDDGNESYAAQVRRKLDDHGVFAISIQGGGGCGKTTLLEATLKQMNSDRRCAVIEGDAFSTVDAERIAALGIPVVQVNTDGGCHLAANMVLDVLPMIDLQNTDILFIENVGNLHYTAKYRLGEHRRVACLSCSGGLAMAEKYPNSFRASDVNLITKTDLAEYVKFDVPRAVSKLRQLNVEAKVLVTDALSGDGIDMFCRCIRREIDNEICPGQ